MRKGLLSAQPYLRYVLAIGLQSGDSGWKVCRRYSQFVELHDELAVQLPSALKLAGASLPSKLRLPGPLEVEGKDRLGKLQIYLDRLMRVDTLRRSEPLARFLCQDATKLARWRSTVGDPHISDPVDAA